MSAAVADHALDLGTGTTRVAARGRGIVLEIPTIVATREGRGRGPEIVALGEEARKLYGRAPEGTQVVRPIVGGVIADPEAFDAFLRAVVKQAGVPSLKRKRLLATIAAPLTDAERDAFERALRGLGAAEVALVPGVFAAAVGAGLPVTDPVASMVVDLGAGRTQVGVISLGGLVLLGALPIGGDTLDDAIARYLRDAHQIVVADRSTETLKVRIGSVTPAVHSDLRMRVRGRDLPSGRPREIELEAVDVARAVAEPIAAIRGAVLAALAQLPPELAADLVDRGILLTGGASQLRGLDLLLREATGVPVLPTERPAQRAILGAETLLGQAGLLDRIEMID